MAKEGGYTIENIYQGGYSTLDPNKAYSNTFTGYRTNVGSLGLTTNPQTANQLKEVSDKLSSGLKNVEIELISTEVMDSIPIQHLKEINQLNKLAGGEVSVHGPVIDTIGMTREGFSELNRQLAERKITETLLRSHELNPNGNITVNFHSAEGIPGSEWKSLGDIEGKKPREAKKILAVERESGRMTALEEDKRFLPGKDLSEPEKYSPEENLRIANYNAWADSLTPIEFNRESAERILSDVHPILGDLYNKIEKSRATNTPLNYELSQDEADMMKKIYSANEYLNEAEKKAKSNFSRAYELAKRDNDKQTMEILNEVSKQYAQTLKLDKDGNPTQYSNNPKVRSQAIYELKQGLEMVRPKLIMPIEEFAVEKSSQTFGNAAFNVFNKFKDVNKTPITLIENPPAGFGLSTGEDLKKLVVESRKQFVDRAVKEKNMNPKEAEKIAEKLIGATWDVGHINMLRKEGFKDEDIIRESEKVAPFVKHVHLSDNFGFEHTELPMGMGNVPMKEIMAKLGEKGFEGKKIIEAGTWWQQFKTSPIKEALEGLGSPMYMTGPGPYWNQSLGLQQNYFSGYGMMLPTNNYQTFGAGFSQLPQELGGEVQRGGGRFSQRGME